MRKSVLRRKLGLRLRLLLLEGASGVGEAVLSALLLLLLKEIRRWLGYDRSLVWQGRISWHHVPLWHPIAWIWRAEWTSERRVGPEAWGSLRGLTCTRCEHTACLSGARAITWSMHIFAGVCGARERTEKRGWEGTNFARCVRWWWRDRKRDWSASAHKCLEPRPRRARNS